MSENNSLGPKGKSGIHGECFPPAIEYNDGDIASRNFALKLCQQCDSIEIALAIFTEWNKSNIPPWPDTGTKSPAYWIERAWNYVHSGNANLSGARIRLPEVETLDYARTGRIVAKYGPGRGQKVCDSSLAIPTPALIVDYIFSGDPWLGVARVHPGDQCTIRRSRIRGYEPLYAWLCPNTFKAKWADNKGKRSMKCDVNIDSRRHFVIEFDLKAKKGWGDMLKKWSEAGLSLLDVHTALFYWLVAQGTPRLKPFMIVYSGNASYHAWYDARGLSEETIAAFITRTLPLGGDRVAFVPSQLFRMPGGTRLMLINNQVTRVCQEVVFWRPYSI